MIIAEEEVRRVRYAIGWQRTQSSSKELIEFSHLKNTLSFFPGPVHLKNTLSFFPGPPHM